MRILHLDMGREMRGGQHQALTLMKGLRERGHSPELLAREGSPLWNAAGSSGFPVSPATVHSIWRRSLEVDLVHAHDARSHALASVASRGVCVVSRRVAFPVSRSPLSRWKYRRAARYLAVSKCVARELEQVGIASGKIDVVYDGVELQPLGNRPPEADRVVVALASSDPEKGRKLVEQAGSIAGVAITFSSDLPRDFERASLFVYATRSEGLGSAALLAMSRAVPVIASCVGGLPEAIEDNESGLLVPNKPGEIAAAIRRVLSDPELARTLGSNARLRIEQNFTQEHMVVRTLASYAKALAS